MAALERLARRPSWLLSRAAARSQSLLADAFSAEGVRGYHYRILAALDEHGPSSQADVGRNADIDRSDVVATVNDLVQRGLARRAPDPRDGRRNVITSTARGARTLKRLDSVVDGVQEALLEPLTPSERKALVRLLTKLG